MTRRSRNMRSNDINALVNQCTRFVMKDWKIDREIPKDLKKKLEFVQCILKKLNEAPDEEIAKAFKIKEMDAIHIFTGEYVPSNPEIVNALKVVGQRWMR